LNESGPVAIGLRKASKTPNVAAMVPRAVEICSVVIATGVDAPIPGRVVVGDLGVGVGVAHWPKPLGGRLVGGKWASDWVTTKPKTRRDDVRAINQFRRKSVRPFLVPGSVPGGGL
jgi:hypothetical protein